MEGVKATGGDVLFAIAEHRVVPRRRRVARPRPAPAPRESDPWGDVPVTELLERFGTIVRRAGGLDALERLVDGADALREALR